MLILIPLLSYFASSVILFLAVCRFLQLENEASSKFFLLTLGLGPIATAWILRQLFWLTPGFDDKFYILTIGALFAILLLYGRKEIYRLFDLLKKLSWFRKLRWASVFSMNGSLVLVLVSSLTVLLVLAVGLPVIENDAVQYAYVSAWMYRVKGFEFYPIIVPDPASGFYATSSHPLGYYALIIWTYLLQGSAEIPGAIRLISPLHIVLLAVLIWEWMRGHGTFIRLLACLLTVLTPILYNQSLDLSIDSLRIFLFVLSFLWVRELIDQPDNRIAVIAGVVTGLSMFVHSLGGLFTGPFVAAAFFLLSRESLPQKIQLLTILTSVAMVVGGGRYIENFLVFGSPFYDTLPLYDMVPELHFREWVQLSRNLQEFWNVVFFGVLSGFSGTEHFGFVYWCAAGALIIWPRRIWAVPALRLALIGAGLFYVALTLMLVIGIDALTANLRYMATPQPFIAVVAAFGLGRIYDILAPNN